jgi:hypothetical protein
MHPQGDAVVDRVVEPAPPGGDAAEPAKAPARSLSIRNSQVRLAPTASVVVPVDLGLCAGLGHPDLPQRAPGQSGGCGRHRCSV